METVITTLVTIILVGMVFVWLIAGFFVVRDLWERFWRWMG